MIDLQALIELVSSSAVTSEDGEHLVQMDYSKFIRSDGALRSAQLSINDLTSASELPARPSTA